MFVLFCLFATVALIDGLIVAGVPIVLLAAGRPRLALAVLLVTEAGVAIDRSYNWPGIAYPNALPLSLLSLPVEMLPMTLFWVAGVTMLCLRRILRDWLRD